MITSLSMVITDYMINEGIIDKDKRNIYVYGFELCICSVISFIIVLIVAMTTRMYLECLLFYLVFSITRLFSGGFHSKTYLGCKITYIGGLLILLVIYKLIYSLDTFYWIILQTFSSLIIAKYAPIDNPNKKLSYMEKNKSKKICFVILALLFIITLVLSINTSFYQMIPLTLLLVAVLMVIVLVKKERGEFYEYKG